MSIPVVVLCRGESTLRSEARADRTRLLTALEAAGAVKVDVAGVERMSDAYADELFGVLTQHFGTAWMVEHLDIAGADDGILRTIAQAIAHGAKLRGARGGPARPPAHPNSLRH